MTKPVSLMLAVVLAVFALPILAQQPTPAAGEQPASAAASAATPAASPAAAAPAPAAAAAPAAEAQVAVKADPAKGEAKFGTVCVACHGAGGNSGTSQYPKLAQQHPEYIVKQLQDFKAGKRVNPIMQPLAATLSEADMANIAAYLSAQAAKPGFAKDKDLVARGEKIYRGGIMNLAVPACAGCHSPNGAGIPAQYPRLSGQHADYIYAQLTAFGNGTRKNSTPMQAIAARLNDHDMHALSDYIAGLR